VVRVKICGLRCAEDIAVAVAAGADAVGVISGIRYRSDDAHTADGAAELARQVPVFVTPVLVTHLNSATEVLALQAKVQAGAIQLHDDVPLEDLRLLREALPTIRLIKAVSVTGASAVEAALRYAPLADALLLDSRTADRIGGTGQMHDWSISRRIVEAVRKPVMLAGGLTPDNVAQAIAQVRPYGVDVNTGVKAADGCKDPDRVRAFVRNARAAAARTD
jgi:phosphoribosylanthranilate isomerase